MQKLSAKFSKMGARHLWKKGARGDRLVRLP